MYSPTALSRFLSPLLTLLLTLSCAGVTPAPKATPFPEAPAWKTLLHESVVPPLAAANRRIYVATRDGKVRALEGATGEVLWVVPDLPGVLTASHGTLLVRSTDGRLTSLRPRDGSPRWSVDTGVAGSLPALVDHDRVVVAGQGMASLDRRSGQLLWMEHTSVEITAPPVAAGARVLSGEANGTLRARDRATGASTWTLETPCALLAPPLVDLPRRRAYLGTTDKAILGVNLTNGDVDWRWTVGADIVAPGLLVDGRVLFASFDAVLYALHRNGNLAWRAPLPSRPLSGPLLLSGIAIVACLENEIVAFDAQTGAPVGGLRTSAEISTRPLLTETALVIGLRDRSVVAYPRLGGDDPAPPVPTPEG